MRLMNRNKRDIWYQTYEGITPETITDEYGNVLETGENSVSYSEPVMVRMSIGIASGVSSQEMFGGLDDYDRILITEDLNCPIDEHSVLYIETDPDEDDYDYIVKRVAKSLNFIAYAVSKVVVS